MTHTYSFELVKSDRSTCAIPYHTRQHQHPSSNVLDKLANATVILFKAAVHIEFIFLSVNRENFLRSTPRKRRTSHRPRLKWARDRIAKYASRIVPNLVTEKDQPPRELSKSRVGVEQPGQALLYC
ncbi:hypothetical protein CEXT_226221 [Caerostris extrusa]|uniref:Uncharacterized protein n=1 Tax=Caerostris extrusa TaxID=172846 RepID=A0AAV4QH49_CAEEX|nr:hypothetical protein CEXT_226221 [Caerostris extrusa]